MSDSSSKTGERRHHFRGRSHIGRRIDLWFRAHSDPSGALIRGIAGNLGVGGAFVRTDALKPAGTRLHIEVCFPNATNRLQLQAEVRWHQDSGSDLGMGVQFIDLSPSDLLALRESIARMGSLP